MPPIQSLGLSKKLFSKKDCEDQIDILTSKYKWVTLLPELSDKLSKK